MTYIIFAGWLAVYFCIVMKKKLSGHSIYITSNGKMLHVKLNAPESPIGMIIMCDDQDQSEQVSRNDLVRQIFNKERFATIQVVDDQDGICDGLVVLPTILNWLTNETKYSYLPVAAFCSGRSASGSLRASVNASKKLSAIAIRSGVLDLTPAELALVDVPVLFITADRDEEVTESITSIISLINAPNSLKIISNASRYFTELGKLGHVVFLAVEWFRKNMFANAKTA